MNQVVMTNRIGTHACPIEECPTEIPTALVMCRTHWALVPKPIQQDVYSLCRKRRGGPSHVAAVRRAIQSVRDVLDRRARNRAGYLDGNVIGWLPYRDD